MKMFAMLRMIFLSWKVKLKKIKKLIKQYSDLNEDIEILCSGEGNKTVIIQMKNQRMLLSGLVKASRTLKRNTAIQSILNNTPMIILVQQTIVPIIAVFQQNIAILVPDYSYFNGT